MDELKLPHHHGEGEDTALLQAQVNRTDHFQTVAEVFKQLCDTTRIRVFWLLCHCEECVVNISAILDMSSPAVSHHLKTLKCSGLIVSRRDGKEVYYRAADTEQGRLLHEMIEQIMEITCPEQGDAEETAPEEQLKVYPPEQLRIVRAVHGQLTRNIGQRITIEDLCRQYPINPTTLKAVFKSVYGTSIAAHIKEHRMEQAAKLLRESGKSIAEIARAVGYDSQSRFTAAFKTYFHVLPKEYRKSGPAPAAPAGAGEDKSPGAV